MEAPKIPYTAILMNLQPDFIQLGMGIRLSSIRALARNLGLSPEGTREYLKVIGVPTATIGETDYVSLPALDVALHRLLKPAGGWSVGRQIETGPADEWSVLQRIGDLYLRFSKKFIEKRCKVVGRRVKESAMIGLPIRKGGLAFDKGGRRGTHGRPRTYVPNPVEIEARKQVTRPPEWTEPPMPKVPRRMTRGTKRLGRPPGSKNKPKPVQEASAEGVEGSGDE